MVDFMIRLLARSVYSWPPILITRTRSLHSILEALLESSLLDLQASHLDMKEMGQPNKQGS